MGKRIPVIINRFDGGMTDDHRSTTASKFALTKHFDSFTFPHKLVPYSSTGATDGQDKTKNIKNFVYAGGQLWGLGDPSSGNTLRMQIFQNQGLGSTDNWVAMPGGIGTTTPKATDIFFAYAYGGVTYLYARTGSGYFSKYNTSGDSMTDQEQAATFTATWQCQPVLHPSDNIAYFFADNVVLSNNAGSWTAAALTLPSNLRIVASCPYGNYLALGCITTDTYNVQSTVFLWDRDSSLTTLTERIDFGEGSLKHLATLDNQLMGVMDFYTSPAFGNPHEGRLLVKKSSGNTALLINQLATDANSTVSPNFPNSRYVRNNILYFPAAVRFRGDDRLGIWAVKSTGAIALTVVFSEITTNQTFQAIYATGPTWWAAHSGDGSVSRTSYANNNAYGTSAKYQSLVFTGGDSSLNKKLLGVTVTIASDSNDNVTPTVTIAYKKDTDSSFTTIASNAYTSIITHDSINIESTGANLPLFHEIQFQITSGSGPITSLRFSYEVVEDSPYEP